MTLVDSKAELLFAGDFDGDGAAEIVARVKGPTRFVEPVTQVYRRSIDGAYTASNFSLPSGPLTPVDVNADRLVDLIDHSPCAISVRLAQGPSSFTGPIPSGSSCHGGNRALPLDFDADGHVDLLMTPTFGSARPVLYLGDGNGGFRDFSPTMPFAYQGSTIGAADFDGDGVQDLAALLPGQPWALSIAFGAGRGNLTNIANWEFGGEHVPFSTFNVQAVIQDMNRDGLPDIVYFPGFAGGFYTLLATAPGRFDAPPTYTAFDLPPVYGMDFVDINGDGVMDAVSMKDVPVIRLGTGSGGWSEPIYPMGLPSTGTPTTPSAFKVIDVDGDKRPDIVASSAGRLVVLRYRAVPSE